MYGHELEQTSIAERPEDGGAWCAAVQGITKSWTQLSNWTATQDTAESMVCDVWRGVRGIAESTWLSSGSLVQGEVSHHKWEQSLWRGPLQEEMGPPDNRLCNLLVPWLNYLGSWPSSNSDSFTAASWVTLNWTNQLSHSWIPASQKTCLLFLFQPTDCFHVLHFGVILNAAMIIRMENSKSQNVEGIIPNIFLYSPKFCTYRLSMKMEYTVSCVSDFLKLSSLVPLLRKHLKDVLHQTEGVNQETERYGLRESRVEYHLGSQETQNRLFRKTER